MQCVSYENICKEKSTLAADVSHCPRCLSKCTHLKEGVDQQLWLNKRTTDMKNGSEDQRESLLPVLLDLGYERKSRGTLTGPLCCPQSGDLCHSLSPDLS